MPGKELRIENGDVVGADAESRKYQECPRCDYICGTEEGLEMHKSLRHSEEGDE